MKYILFLFICGVTYSGKARAGETCTNYNRHDIYFYCESDCCESWPYEKCCPETVWLGWAIAGGVIGGILLISLIVCVVCVCIKQKGKTGRVIQPSQGATVSHVTYPQNQVYFQQYIPTGVAIDPSAPPPPYQSIYGQQYGQQHHLPPLPIGGQQQQQQQHQGQRPLNQQWS